MPAVAVAGSRELLISRADDAKLKSWHKYKTEMLVLYKNIIKQVEPEDAAILTSTQLWLVATK